MSKHHYYRHKGDSIEVVGTDNELIAEGKEILFTDYSDTETDGIVHGTLVFRRSLKEMAAAVEAVIVYGLDDEDEVFYHVLEEVMLSDEPDGPQENHYSFTAERISEYAGSD